MSKQNNPQTLILLGVVILFLGLFAYYYLLLIPSNEKVEAQRKEMETLDKQIQLLTKKVAEQDQKNEGLSMDQIQAALPLWDNIEQLILDISKLKQQTSVTFSTISFSADDKKKDQADGFMKAFPNVREVKVSASLIGTYTDVMNTIALMQNMPRLITVDTINFGSLPKDPTRKITVSLTFTAYFDPSYKDKVDKVLVPSFE